MLRPLLWATFAVATVVVSGEFVILHSPDSVIFKGNEEINQSLVTEVFSAVLGMTIKQRSTWSGVKLENPLNLPKAVVSIVVEGIDNLQYPKEREIQKFPLIVDEDEETTWQALNGRLEERVKNNPPVRIRVADGVDHLGQSALGELKLSQTKGNSLQSLNIEFGEDRKIFEEIQLLNAIAHNVRLSTSTNRNSKLYWLVVSGMLPLIDRHGKDSPAVNEAFTLLHNALDEVSDAFKKHYKNNVVIAAFTSDGNKVRHTRAINLERVRRADPPNPIKDDSDKNVNASENSSTTPVIESIKNDEEESEKNEDEEAKTRTSDVGSSLKKDDESPSITESYETTSENKGNETNESRESSTVKSDHELENTTRNNEHSSTGTENTNRPSKFEDLKLAKKYSESYPVIFNIILWFGVAFVFSLIAICITIADMDPGRDSIIYRMTSTRMKKDN